MKVITEAPIEVRKVSNDIYSGCDCGHSSLDGSSLSTDISAFQKFAKGKGAKNANGSPLTVDGKWGPNTMSAWIAYGKEWDLMQNTQPKPKPTENTTPVDQPAIAPIAKKTIKDKWKALPMPAKIGIGVGGAALLGFIIYLCIPKGKKK